jgi:predicted Rossmann fold flavoprotein
VEKREHNFDVVIVGAGGAGMMCAMQAASRGRRTIILEHGDEVGRKILISGGGRCNFTNLHTRPECYFSQNPHFAKSALSRYTPQDFIALVKKHRIAFHEKKLGQLFCDGSAQNIVDMLVKECRDANVKFSMQCKIASVSKEEKFCLETNQGRFYCDSLVVATGGLSIPKIGATSFGYDLARQFGLKIVSLQAALDGFVFKDDDIAIYQELAGVSIDSEIKCNGAKFRENILFTHTGLSGPACLQASLYWQKESVIEINLLPDINAREYLLSMKKEKGKSILKNILGEQLPKRYAEKFCEVNKVPAEPIMNLKDKYIDELATKLQRWQIYPQATVGYRKAEVTRGGVDTKELSSSSMEAKKVPGLYFIGEVVDVTGWLGGYNFQWAWASGYAAGNAV